MPKTYVTFGQNHVHRVNGKTFDCECVAVINCPDHLTGRAKTFEYFNSKFRFEYHEDQWTTDKAQYFPRGFIEVNPPPSTLHPQPKKEPFHGLF